MLKPIRCKECRVRAVQYEDDVQCGYCYEALRFNEFSALRGIKLLDKTSQALVCWTEAGGSIEGYVLWLSTAPKVSGRAAWLYVRGVE